jgi:hypothetical protein
LVQFLRDLTNLMQFLVKNRVPPDARQLFEEGLKGATDQINQVISQLEALQSAGDPTNVKLSEAGLSGSNLRLKLREFYQRIKEAPVEAVLHMGDVILGSLLEIFKVLEPVKEFKETLENRLKHGGDGEIIGLNLGGNEKWWEKE